MKVSSVSGKHIYIIMTHSVFKIVDVEKYDDHATLFCISSGDDIESDYFDVNDYNNMIAWFHSTHDLIAAGLKRGDIIHNLDMGEYRNDGKFIYDGNTLAYLDYSIDEYGSVPNSFHVLSEFPLYYWDKHIAHNSIVHANVSDLIDVDFTEYNALFYDMPVFVYFAIICHHNKKYGVFVFSKKRINPIESISGLKAYNLDTNMIEEIDMANELHNFYKANMDGFLTLHVGDEELESDIIDKNDTQRSSPQSD